MGNKSQLMWQKGYAIKTKNHIVVDMCIGVPVFLRHSVYAFYMEKAALKKFEPIGWRCGRPTASPTLSPPLT